MNGFVLSGGANLGSIQAGMLEALLDAGITPGVLVGTSIGAANAAFIAGDPTPDGARALSDIWRTVRARDVFPLSLLRLGRGLFREGSVFSPQPLRRFLERRLPYRAFEDARVPLRITATRFENGEAVVFDSGPVIEAIMASTALPVVFPPHAIDGRHYLDGGLSDQVPLTPAIEAGADTIYVLSVGFPCPPPEHHRSARAVLMHSIGLLLSQRLRIDVTDLPRHHPALEVVHIPPVCTQVGLRDFSRSGVLIDRAREQTAAFLRGEECPACPHPKPDGVPATGLRIEVVASRENPV